MTINNVHFASFRGPVNSSTMMSSSTLHNFHLQLALHRKNYFPQNEQKVAKEPNFDPLLPPFLLYQVHMELKTLYTST